MVVLYYVTTHFLEPAIYTIQSIKDRVELHLIIEITPHSKKSSIINIEQLDSFRDIEDCEHVFGHLQWNFFKKYFEGIRSANFLIHKNKRNFSFESYRVTRVLGKYIKHLNPDIIHFDSITERSIGLYPYIRSKKVFITIHDPKRHLGEASWKKKVPNLVFLRLAKGYFFYSNFACTQFEKHYKLLQSAKYVIRFQPFTHISQFLDKTTTDYSDTILFFGRLSFYKGIDVLLEAIPKILEKYPEEKFIIAGSADYKYKINLKTVRQYPNNIRLITRYLSTDELAKYIQNSKFVICPYRDATQSGVLMTSFAAGKMVIATNIGAFPEYITDNVNGLLADVSGDSIAKKIIEALENQKYYEMEKRVQNGYSEKIGIRNQECILNAYQSSRNE